MSFNVGDFVELLDDNLSGTIVKIKGISAIIETDDGFQLEFPLKDLVLVKNDTSLKANIFTSHDIDEILNEKTIKKPKSVGVKKKQRFQPTIEIDLHIEKLVPTYKRMQPYEILEYQLDVAKRQIESAIRKRIQKVVFIHGVGDGVLKIELEYLIKRFENLKYYEADYQKYGLGATEVYIPQSAM